MDARTRLLLLTDPYAGYRRTAAMTLSGNEITDTVRAAGVKGDGVLAPDNSVGIWPAATNLCTNGGFETNTTGWATAGTNAIARSSDVAKFGGYSLQATYQDDTTLASFGITLTAAAHSASAWVYIPSAFDGASVTLGFVGFAGATGTLTATANLSLRDQWQRVTVRNVTIAGGDLAGSIDVTCGAPTAGRFVYVDGVQIESGAIATPYVETSGGTASRTAARVRVPTDGLFTPTDGWCATRCTMPYASGTDNWGTGWYDRLMAWGVAGVDSITVEHFASTATQHKAYITRWTAGVNQNKYGTPYSFEAGADQTIIGRWDASTVAVSTNGGAFESGASTTVPAITATTLDVGSYAGGASYARRNLYWQAYGSGPLTDAQASILHAMGNRPDYHALRRMGATGIWDCREPAVLRY